MHFSNPFAHLMLKMQRIRYGKKCKFFGLPVIAQKNGGKIEIGNNMVLASGFLSNMVGMYQRSIIVARNGGTVKIGNRVSMSAVTVYAFKHIEIGDNTLIGANTKIFDSDFHPVDPQIRMVNRNDKEHTAMADTIIGENVFIGCNALILKGVHVGNNSVVGAGSVVTKDVPANCIVGGNPAKVIKYFNLERNENGESEILMDRRGDQ